MGSPHKLTANQKKSFWSVVSSYSMQQWTISRSDCDVWWKVDFIWQPEMTSSVARLRRSSKALLKAKLPPKNGHDHCLVVCCLSDPLELSESPRNHYIWEVCSANHWDAPKTAAPTAGIGQQKGPNSSPWQCPIIRCTTNASEGEQTGLWSFASSTIFNLTSHQSTTTSSSILTTFFRKNAFTTSRR